jgi:hypothetical protein
MIQRYPLQKNIVIPNFRVDFLALNKMRYIYSIDIRIDALDSFLTILSGRMVRLAKNRATPVSGTSPCDSSPELYIFSMRRDHYDTNYSVPRKFLLFVKYLTYWTEAYMMQSKFS